MVLTANAVRVKSDFHLHMSDNIQDTKLSIKIILNYSHLVS